MMIRGFFDESEQGDVFLVAGWVTDYETWDRFTSDWRETLDAEPAIKYFKHHEAKSDPPSGQFEGWAQEQIEVKISRLVDVICRHEMYGVSCGLNTTTHNAAFAGSMVSKRTLKSVFKTIHHYHSCVFSAHALVMQIQRSRGQMSDKVDLVFDEMSGMMAECITFYDSIKNRFPLDMQAIAGTMTEADDKEVEALQAADLLAGQITTSLRHQDEHLPRMGQTHEIHTSLAYLPNFDKLPDFITRFNIAWSVLQLERIVEQSRVDPKPPKEQS